MAVARVQGTGVQSVGSVADLAKAFDSNVTAGNTIAVGAVSNANTLGVSAVTDSLGNGPSGSYTRDAFIDGTAAGRAESAIYKAFNIVGGACTVTVNPTGSDFVSFSIAEYSGTGGTDPLDGSGTVSVSAAAATTSTFTMAGDGVIFAVLEHNGGAATITEATTLVYENENVTSAMPINSEEEFVSAGVGKSASWTLNASRPITACAIGIKEGVLDTSVLVHLSTTGGWVF